ncbi:MAG: [NiFe]-hydrogenase assembly chaperone HybE [Gammaproteobacteria bacterium]
MKDIIDNLVARFQQIGVERIFGLPIYNDALSVEAVEFQPCEGGLIGVLITPWFMNIMLLPEDTSPWQTQELGVKVKYKLESGEHEFVIGEDEEGTLLTPPEQEEQELPADLQQVDFTSEIPEEKHNSGRREFLRNIVPS